MLHGGFVLFNPADVGATRARAEVSGEAGELVGRANGVYADPAVIFVADPAGDSQFVRTMLGEPAEADALDAAVDEPFTGGEWGMFGVTHIYAFMLRWGKGSYE